MIYRKYLLILIIKSKFNCIPFWKIYNYFLGLKVWEDLFIPHPAIESREREGWYLRKFVEKNISPGPGLGEALFTWSPPLFLRHHLHIAYDLYALESSREGRPLYLLTAVRCTCSLRVEAEKIYPWSSRATYQVQEAEEDILLLLQLPNYCCGYLLYYCWCGCQTTAVDTYFTVKAVVAKRVEQWYCHGDIHFVASECAWKVAKMLVNYILPRERNNDIVTEIFKFIAVIM